MSSANISIYLSGVQEITTILLNEAWQSLHSAMVIAIQIQYYLLSNISSNKTHIHCVIKTMCLYSCWVRDYSSYDLDSPRSYRSHHLLDVNHKWQVFLSKGRQYSKTGLKERDETTAGMDYGIQLSVPYVQVLDQRTMCQVQL